MYFATINLLFLVFPAAFIGIEASHNKPSSGLIFPTGKWFVFWSIGIRLFLAGARQGMQPHFTAEEIFRVRSTDSLPIIRELGFANLSMGTVAASSLFQMNWIVPVAIAGAIYYGLAGLDHFGQKTRNTNEYIAMISNGYAFLVISVF